MSLSLLGEQIDIHGGGQDVIFPHHENEIRAVGDLHRPCALRAVLGTQRPAAPLGR